MATPAQLSALAARTPVGLNHQDTAAAIRAGISRVSEHEYVVDAAGEPIRGAFDGLLPPRLPSLDRMLEFAEHCIRQLAAQFPAGRELKVPLLLSLPEPRPGFSEDDQQQLEAGLKRLTAAGPLRLSSVRTVAHGHAGAIKALGLASQLVHTLSEGACVVAGIETYSNPNTLEWLSRNGQLAGPQCRSGFFPGEGAAFALVTTQGVRRTLRLPHLASLLGTGAALETSRIKSDDENFGRAMTEAVLQACQAAPGPVTDLYTDINGERYRTEEVAFTILRTALKFRDASEYVTPTTSCGDLGAATGILLAALAVGAWQREWAHGKLAMLTAGSEAGLRSALLLERGQLTV